jgi:hypothetical protein
MYTGVRQLGIFVGKWLSEPGTLYLLLNGGIRMEELAQI